jgi:hypothetical protein
MTPQEFIAKWQRVNLSERSACQQHFLDLCDVLGQPKPAEADPDGAWYTFERGVRKTTGEKGWAEELDELRNNWLNPPEWTREEVLEFPGSVDGPWARYVHEPDERGIGTLRYPRIAPKDEECAKKLKKRTLTNLYNQRPTWLDLAHRKLDETVFAAYGWEPTIADEELLEKLLELNLERAKDE